MIPAAIQGLAEAARGAGLEPVAVLTPREVRDAEDEARRAALVAEELPRTGRLWLYDPTIMAGYPLGATIFDLDNVGTAVAMALLPLEPAHAFKLIVWACDRAVMNMPTSIASVDAAKNAMKPIPSHTNDMPRSSRRRCVKRLRMM